jgi:hypothetical protein
MKKTDLLKPGGNRAHHLTLLAREINERQETIELARGKVLDAGSTLVCEAIFQGAALLKVKAILKHGDFLPWVKAHCPLISHDTANRYMRLALNTGNGKNLEGATSIREALVLCAPPEADGAQKPAREEPRSWPPYLEALSRLGKFAGLVERNPIQQWPLEGREKLKADLEPIVATLWPEKFA